MFYRENNCWASRLLGAMLIGLVLLVTLPVSALSQAPVINVWYGQNQQFGHNGNSQPWANILGNVSDSDGIAALNYSLNGGSTVSLTVGPDSRRLVSSGDFNIDLATADLIDGNNQIIITATDNLTNTTVDTVTVDYTSGTVWSLPDTVEWDGASAIDDVAQVVDGLWGIQPGNTVRTTIPGYDRLVAIGDTQWTDYEVTVPITFHTMPGSFGTGILFRWGGHTDNPVSGTQPKSGWLPLGCICWARANKLELYGNNADIIGSVSRTLTIGVTYIFKARVETIPGLGGLYSMKVWVEGQPEPVGWDLTGQETLADPQSGSMTLISHHADVSFGRVVVTELPLTLGNIAVTLGSGGTTATVTWTTNQPATSSVAYGPTTAYELGTITDTNLVINHSVTLTGITPDATYHYLVTSVDGLSNSADSGDRTFTATASILVSDDFSSPVLNTSVWTFVDPLTDGSYTLTGTNTADAWVNISVPAGVEHQVWTSGIQVPHLLQATNDVDFEIEVKLESPISQQHQEQGVVIRQDDGNFLRFEFFSTDSETKIYVASFVNYTPATRLNAVIDNINVAPLYMRVKRSGDQWTQTYSYDGTTWLGGTVFTHAIAVTGVGIYGGNALGTSSPAHTASFDYFFNTDSPIDPEDPTLPWMISNIQATPGDDSAVITWDTNELTTSVVSYGPTAAYEDGTISDATLVTQHSITLPGLTPSTLYHYQVTSVDTGANSISSGDLTFTTTGPDLSGIVSDDFNAPTLDTGIWTWVDPLTDGTLQLTGAGTSDAWANISVPAGLSHEVFDSGIYAPHLLQAANDTDFEVEVKFESMLALQFQEAGIVVKQDDDNYLRLEFYSTTTTTTIYARGFTPTTSPTYSNTVIGANNLAPLYMRVKRVGDQWTQSYSMDGRTGPICRSSHTY